MLSNDEGPPANNYTLDAYASSRLKDISDFVFKIKFSIAGYFDPTDGIFGVT